MSKRTGIGRVAASAVLALWLAAPLLAQPAGPVPPDVKAESQRLAYDIMSPYCPGRTLATCPSSAAADLRDDITRRLAAGESADAIVESLVVQFGPEVRGAPPATGVGWALWLAPLGIGGVVLAALMVSYRGARTGEAGTPAPTVPDALWHQLDDDLADLD